jgi:hypothetical protein
MVINCFQLHTNQRKFLEFIVFDMEESDTTNDKRYHPLKEIVQGGTYAESERAMLNDLLRTTIWRYKLNKQ